MSNKTDATDAVENDRYWAARRADPDDTYGKQDQKKDGDDDK